MSRIAYASRMTPARPRGRSVALAVLMVVLFLTFLDNTVVSGLRGLCGRQAQWAARWSSGWRHEPT